MVPAGPHLTRVAMQPCQEGLSTIDFCFTGVSSSDSTRQKECDGINGKMCWTLVTNHFMGMKHGDTRISKGPLLCNGSCTSSANAILPAQTSVCIWTKVANFSTTQKCKISLQKKVTQSTPQDQTTLTKMDLSSVDIVHQQTPCKRSSLAQIWMSNSGLVHSVSNALPEPF